MTPKFMIRLVVFAAMVMGCSLGGIVAPPPAPTQIPVTAALATSQSTGQHIQFKAGTTSTVVTGQLAPNATDKWVVNVQSGQSFSATLSFISGEATLLITDRNGKPILDESAHATTFSDVMPSTQDYQISVVGGDKQSTDYSLAVVVQDVQTPSPKRIQLTAGTATVSGQVLPNSTEFWIISVQAGQTLSADLKFTSGTATMNITGADGAIVKLTNPTSNKVVLPTSQDYNIIIVGNYETTTPYTLTVGLQ